MKISACIITYNQETYIKECLEGVLKQKLNCTYEIVIGEDCSTDNTLRICKIYAEKYPDLIRILPSSKNLGMIGNWMRTISDCKGKYIAFCEGDDYWTDPLKLQKQVDFMEENLNYSMCFHKVDVTFAHEGDFYEYDKPANDILSIKDIMRKHYIATCSLVFRNGYFKKGLPSWFAQSISGDLPLEILLASKGLTKYLDDTMACYRRNPGGITQSVRQIAKIRSGYIFMYSKLAQEIKFPHSFYLHYIVLRLRVGYLKVYYNKIKSIF